jgi:uncharacterized protein (DUF1330 family)
MRVYFVVHIKMIDEDIYKKYLAECEQVFRKYEGKYLAVDNRYELVEGESDYTRIVMISFESEERFEQWYYSDEYQRIVKYRLLGARCDSILVHGE